MCLLGQYHDTVAKILLSRLDIGGVVATLWIAVSASQ